MKRGLVIEDVVLDSTGDIFVYEVNISFVEIAAATGWTGRLDWGSLSTVATVDVVVLSTDVDIVLVADDVVASTDVASEEATASTTVAPISICKANVAFMTAFP